MMRGRRSCGRSGLAVTLVVTLMAVSALTTAVVASRASAPGGGGNGSAREPAPLRRTPGAERITFDLVLRMPGQAAFDAYARDVDAPGSPDFRHFLTAVEVGARFGLSDTALAGLDAQLTRRHLAVVERYPERSALRVSGTARAVEATFGVVLDDYVDHALGVRFHRPRTAPLLDRTLRATVRGVSGLDSQPPLLARRATADMAFRSARSRSTGVAPPNSLTPDVLSRAFDIAPLHAAGILGSGEFVAILSDSDIRDSDVEAWDQATGTVGAPPIQHVRVGFGRLRNSVLEAALDVDTVRAVAPQAQIILFNVSDSFSPTFLADALREVLRDGRATIFSASFSACDVASTFGAQRWDRESSLQAVKTARAAGVNLVFSTGDWKRTAGNGDPSPPRFPLMMRVRRPSVAPAFRAPLTGRTSKRRAGRIRSR